MPNKNENPINKKIKDGFSLYKRNVLGTFFGGYRMVGDALLKDGGWPVLLVGLIHTVTLPISMTAGAGIKTIIDLSTRTTISESELETLQNSIANMDQNQMLQLITAINTYTSPRSNSSQILKSELQSAANYANEKLEELINEACQKKFEEKKNEIQTRRDDAVGTGNGAVNIYELEEADRNQIKQEITQENLEKLKDEAFTNQKNLIINFLKETKNNGKHMEHVILTEVKVK